MGLNNAKIVVKIVFFCASMSIGSAGSPFYINSFNKIYWGEIFEGGWLKLLKLIFQGVSAPKAYAKNFDSCGQNLNFSI